MNLIKSHLKIIIFLIVSAQANADVQPADNDKIISLYETRCATHRYSHELRVAKYGRNKK